MSRKGRAGGAGEAGYFRRGREIARHKQLSERVAEDRVRNRAVVGGAGLVEGVVGVDDCGEGTVVA